MENYCYVSISIVYRDQFGSVWCVREYCRIRRRENIQHFMEGKLRTWTLTYLLKFIVKWCYRLTFTLACCHTHVRMYIQEIQDNSDAFGYKVQETKRGWSSVVNQRVVTNLITPANFCNGEDHSFIVMAINNCGLHGPPSAAAIGKCGK